MANREILVDWVVEALQALGGRARIVDICKHIWSSHENDLRKTGDLFYTWQYDMRWAGQVLRNSGTLKPLHGDRSGFWELKK